MTENLKIDCLGEEWDGEYPLVVPTTRENRTFRVAANIDPDEMTKIAAAGSIELGALIAYAAIRRSGKVSDEAYDEVRRNTLISRLLDLPMDVLSEIVNSAGVDDELDEDGGVIPPVSEPGGETNPSGSQPNDGTGSPTSSGT